VRSCLQVCYPLLTPTLSYLKCWDNFGRSHEHPRNATTNQPGAHTWKARMSRPKGGSADLWGRPTPGWALLHCVFSRWLSGGSSRQFQVPMCAVWMHRWDVALMWRLSIRRVFFPWIDGVVDPVDAYVAAFYWLSLNCLNHGGVLSPIFLC
jgi:hypothetical protein